MKKRILTSCVLFALSCYANTALSYGEDGNEEDDEFSDEFGDFYGGEEFVSIATGTRKTLSKAPAIASVITAEDILRTGAKNLVEALSLVPGLNISRSSQIMGPKFNFRGITSTFSPQTLMMVNGTPTTSVVRGDNHIVWGEHPVHSISRIEIIRGPGSALYGADAFAGVINIITKSHDELQKSEIGASYGSFESRGAWISTSADFNDVRFGLSLEYLTSNGHDETIEQDAQFGLDFLAEQLFSLPPVSVAPGKVNVGFDALDIMLDINFLKLNAKLLYQERGDVGTGQGVAEALDPAGKLGGNKILFDLTHTTEPLMENWLIRTHLTYFQSSQEIEEDLNLFPPGTFFGTFPNGLIGNPGWDEYTLGFNLKTEYTGIDNHHLSFGTGFLKQDLYKVEESKNFFSDLTPRPNGVEAVSDTAEVFIPEANRTNRFVFVQDIWQLAPDWELTAGIRYDHYSDFGNTLNPRLALVWSSSHDSTTKFLYGRAFRAPAFAELLTVNNPVSLGNPNLSPETIDSFEVAYIKKHDNRHSTSINLFYYEIDEFITFVPDSRAPTATAQNVGERSGYGLEIETSINLSENVIMKANYSYAKSNDDLIDEDVGDYPNHQVKSEIDWNISDNWELNLNLNYVGKRQRTPFDTRTDLDSFSDVRLNVIYTNSNLGLRTNLTFKNLLNDDIFEPSLGPSSEGGTVNIPFDLPQAGSAIYFSISKEFN